MCVSVRECKDAHNVWFTDKLQYRCNAVFQGEKIYVRPSPRAKNQPSPPCQKADTLLGLYGVVKRAVHQAFQQSCLE